ncbi:serine palmitoyltransferase 1 [Anthonomus grandis grandis]|uniref:serine palmitoyltransferase 1 n=1 Tax=Anthonomus grandis grandis TaxID=2921223 RepID=UPI002165CB8B|nr:serine palmitoyltransferase 1 [Anthonomus grandis grandis]
MPSRKAPIDEALLAQRLAEFTPEPLVKYHSQKSKHEIEIPGIVEDDNTIDLAKTNFLNILNNEDIKKRCEATIRKYGVGTCGPRAFYGTTDVHLELEEHIAKFLGMQESIVYSYGFVTISSSIAAYCKKSDIVFTDKNCNVPIQQGLQMARSRVIYFDHQDPKSFSDAVGKVVQQENEMKKKFRKFLVVEGVSWKTGQVLQLPEFLKVCEDNKIRVFLEETYSIGVYGENGRGLMEHFNIEPWRLDMVIATLEAAIGSIGGFCAGSHTTIEHQRLSGSGYIFSASLPTFLVQACIESINLLEAKPHHKLRKLAQNTHDMLLDIGFEVQSDPICPFKVFNVPVDKPESRKLKEQMIHEYCKHNGLHFILNDDSLVINLNVVLFEDKQRYGKIEDILKKAYGKVMEG